VYGLKDGHLQTIIAYVERCPEVERAVLFGSRALGTYRPASDIDIALFGDGVTAGLAAALKFKIEEETGIPYFCDFVAYPKITNNALKDHIDRRGVTVYTARKR
jgi:predicted nucleotidyltransferase